MISHRLLIAAASIASVVTTACSDITGPIEMQAESSWGDPRS